MRSMRLPLVLVTAVVAASVVTMAQARYVEAYGVVGSDPYYYPLYHYNPYDPPYNASTDYYYRYYPHYHKYYRLAPYGNGLSPYYRYYSNSCPGCLQPSDYPNW